MKNSWVENPNGRNMI
jgi:hypothetical protein